MASRGSLPGFLRRSVRADYSEDDDDFDGDELSGSSSSSSSASGFPRTSKNGDGNGSNGNDRLTSEREMPPPPTAQEVAQPGHESQSISVSSRTSMSPQPNLQTTSSHSSRRSSERLSMNSSQNQSEEPSERGCCDDSQPKRKKTYRESQFEKTFSANVVSMNDLRTLAWNGIPSHYRPQSWKILLGYLPTNASRRQQTLHKKRTEYKDAVAQHYDIDDDSRTVQEQEVLRQVLVDVPRTAPTVPLFRNEKIQRLLARLLYIWAMRHPASSYVQGINDLAMPFIVAFLSETSDTEEASLEIASNLPDGINYDIILDGTIMSSVSDQKLEEVEADCYWCLTNLLAGIQDHYTSDQPGVQRMVLRLEELVNRIDADLCNHFRDTGIEFMQFAFKWMNCLLLREFELRCVIRLWDTYISEQDGFEDFHVYVCAAFLCQFSSQLQGMTFDDLFGFMQDIPTKNWGDTEVEMLLSQAYVLSTLFGGSDAHLTAGNNSRF